MTPKVDIFTLESHLWGAANILRGSPVDRTDRKSYILALLFFKRICDVWDEEYEEAVKTYGEDFGDARWSNQDRLPDSLLKHLIEHFSALSLGNSYVNTGIIGDGYEFLIKKFADATNNKAGEFYTPRSGNNDGTAETERTKFHLSAVYFQKLSFCPLKTFFLASRNSTA